MRTVLTTSKQSNPNVKQAVIPFPRPATRQLKRGQFHAYKLRTTPAGTTSPIYELSISFFDDGTPEEWIKFQRGLATVLKGQNITQGPANYVVAKTLLKGDAWTVFEQSESAHGNQTVPHFELCLDDVADHNFPEKGGQIQKRYMRRKHNGNLTQPLGADELLDILEFGVPSSWRRESTVQGFDSVDQGLR
eukprot:8790537-Ditylum_brightwellii.AAC.1